MMSIDFGDLKWAVVAARHRSLRQAAEVLNIRQSTLSRRIRDLEHELGAVLFERTNGGTRTTQEGKEFLAAVQRIIEEAETVTRRLRSRARGECGRLTIGVHASLSAGNLRASLGDYHQQFPDVEIGLVDGSTDNLISDLDASTIDVAFLAEVNGRWEGTSLPVWSERVVLALPEDHRLSQHDNIRWNDLERERILVPQRGPGMEILKLITTKIGGSGLQIQMHDVSLDRLLTLVGLGLGILPAFEGATGVSCQNVVFRQICDSDGPTRLCFRATWRQENRNPPLGMFLKMLRARYPVLAGDATFE